VIAGTATAVSNRVSRRQAERWSGQDPYAAQQSYQEAPPPQPAYQQPPSGSSTDDKLNQLKELGELRAAGVLTDAEFEVQKEKILAG
jgi:hypothetical protein